MRGVEVPPPEADYTADPAELYFDLAFVFAFNRLVYLLVHHPDWTGFGEFALLITLIWLPWTQFTWSANAVPGNARAVRALFMIATVASIPMASAVTQALDDSGNAGPVFAISLSAILCIALATMIFGLESGTDVRRSIIRYSVNNWVAIVILIAGSFLGREPRIIAWCVAIAVIVLGTVRAGGREWLIRPGHFAERHGLITIIALGELIVALGLPVVEALAENGDLPGSTLVALLAAGCFAGLMWWSIFDRPLRALEHRHEQLEEGRDRGRFARDVYTYAWLAVVGGIVLAAAGLEELVLHPTDSADDAFRWMFVGGTVLTMAGVGIAILRAFRAVTIERSIGALVLLGVGALGASLDGLTVVIVAVVILVVMLATEHLRVEWRYREEPRPATG